MTREALACPAPEELRQYLLGWRPADEEEATRLDEHIATCTSCNERLGQPLDELVAELRVGVGSLEPPSETVRHLMERCKNLLARPTVSSAASGQTGLTAPMPSQVGPYRLLGVLGQGGMGVVYRARHEHHHRLAAIKMIASPLADEELLARFRDEVEAIARLQHPNIIQLFEVGEIDSRPFVALELAEGGNLAEALAGLPQPPRAAAALVETLADAVAAAHEHGVVHRDLKPSNVLLTSRLASKPSEAEWNRAKIADFGLAKLLDSETTRTSTGRALGTPSY
ncbi:MAG: serine/threonine protein kinase, partial [Gemmataceae bacterium]|nr:serine/threonine protein kinase [Gemmataceae bacterium]